MNMNYCNSHKMLCYPSYAKHFNRLKYTLLLEMMKVTQTKVTVQVQSKMYKVADIFFLAFCDFANLFLLFFSDADYMLGNIKIPEILILFLHLLDKFTNAQE